MEVILTRGYGYQRATLVHRKCNVDVGLIGLLNANLIFDTRLYQDVFPGVKGVEVSSNRLAQSILTSCDAEGNEFIMFRDILDHRSDQKAISKEDGFVHRPNQAPKKRKTTKGLYFLVEWIGGTNTREEL